MSGDENTFLGFRTQFHKLEYEISRIPLKIALLEYKVCKAKYHIPKDYDHYIRKSSLIKAYAKEFVVSHS